MRVTQVAMGLSVFTEHKGLFLYIHRVLILSQINPPDIRGFQSASELYRSSDRRRSAKLVPTLADRGCHVVSETSPSDCNFDFLDLEPLLFLPSSSSNCSRG
jgi:hypothetical protein